MNFVFFIPDELRAESVGCYGNPIARTPIIDRLAAEGTRFDQCHVQHTVCTPIRPRCGGGIGSSCGGSGPPPASGAGRDGPRSPPRRGS